MVVKVSKVVFSEEANLLVNEASKYVETILVKKNEWVINAKSLLGVVAISLKPGDEVEITAEGNDEAIEALIALGLFEK